MKLNRLILVVTAFAIGMGYLESAVVVYMREILYPGGFRFPLSPIPVELALTELFREVATLVMLVTVAVIASGARVRGSGSGGTGRGSFGSGGARRFSTGFAWFIYTFAVWDIFYYIFLKLILGWPDSLMTWDVLFLIPTTWTGPVVTPVLVSCTMILLALVILVHAERGLDTRVPGMVWGGLVLGSLVLILGWILDYSHFMLDHFTIAGMLRVKNPEVLKVATRYVPVRFPWWLFGAGEAIILVSIGWYWKTLKQVGNDR